MKEDVDVEWEEMKKTIEENKKFINGMRKAFNDFFDEHFEYSEFEYKEKYRDGIGGKITCKHCGKGYSWKEWGGVRRAAFTRAYNHMREKHGINVNDVYILNIFIDEWCDKHEI